MNETFQSLCDDVVAMVIIIASLLQQGRIRSLTDRTTSTLEVNIFQLGQSNISLTASLEMAHVPSEAILMQNKRNKSLPLRRSGDNFIPWTIIVSVNQIFQDTEVLTYGNFKFVFNYGFFYSKIWPSVSSRRPDQRLVYPEVFDKPMKMRSRVKHRFPEADMGRLSNSTAEVHVENLLQIQPMQYFGINSDIVANAERLLFSSQNIKPRTLIEIPNARVMPGIHFNTCAVVSSSGGLLGSGLGTFIGMWLGTKLFIILCIRNRSLNLFSYMPRLS